MENQPVTRAMRLTRAFLWIAWFVVFGVATYLGLKDADDPSAQLVRDRNVMAGFCVSAGTILAFLTPSNNTLNWFYADDVEVFAIAFVAVGALLPLASDFAASESWSVVLAGFWFVALVFGWYASVKARKKKSRNPSEASDAQPKVEP